MVDGVRYRSHNPTFARRRRRRITKQGTVIEEG